MEGRTALTVYPGMRVGRECLHQRQESLLCHHGRHRSAGGRCRGGNPAQGGKMGGWSLYFKDDKPKFAYIYLAREIYTIVWPCSPAGRASDAPLRLCFDGSARRGRDGFDLGQRRKGARKGGSSTRTRTRLVRNHGRGREPIHSCDRRLQGRR